MNFLAHTLLGFNDDQLIAGQVCGDFVRGSHLSHFPQRIETGIRLHRHLDNFTDQYPAFGPAKSDMQGIPRRFSGIIIDVLFDHFLARDWSRFNSLSLQQHAQNVDEALGMHREVLPDSLQRFRQVLYSERLLERNVELSSIVATLERLSRRSPRFAILALDVQQLVRILEQLQLPFETFYPDLHAVARSFLTRHESATIEEHAS